MGILEHQANEGHFRESRLNQAARRRTLRKGFGQNTIDAIANDERRTHSSLSSLDSWERRSKSLSSILAKDRSDSSIQLPSR